MNAGASRKDAPARPYRGVIVTGAASGIGRAAALAFAAQGTTSWPPTWTRAGSRQPYDRSPPPGALP